MNFRDVPIGSAHDVQNGATPASGEPSYWDGDTPWVSPVDLGKLNTRFIENGERSITQDGYASCGTQMVSAGSIILSIRAPIGHIAIASNSMCFNRHSPYTIQIRGNRTTFPPPRNCIPYAAIRWHDSGNRPALGRPLGHFSRHPDTPLLSLSPRRRFPRPTPERVFVADHQSSSGFSGTGPSAPPPQPIGT